MIKVVGPAGLEPTTLSLGRNSSIQLSYGPRFSTPRWPPKTGLASDECGVDRPGPGMHDHPLISMSTEPSQQSLTPLELPFTTPQAMSRYVTDTGKILPRKYTGLSAKQQRAITRTLKRSRNMLLAP